MNAKFKILIIIFAAILLPISLFANWIGPTEVVKGSWGNGPGQFYIYYGDSGDIFPKNIGVDKFGRIFINDGYNHRIQVFNQSGKLEQIIKAPTEIKGSDEWPYDIFVHPEGALVVRFDGPQTYFLDAQGKILKKVNQYGPAYPVSEGYVFYDTKIKYDLYSLSGDFLKSYTSKPAEISKKRDERLKTLLLPRAKEGAEYGELVVAPNGDVYTWQRSTAGFSILKWKWADESLAPK